jgi:hypothetical protein
MHVMTNLFILFANLHKCEKKIFDFFFEEKKKIYKKNKIKLQYFLIGFALVTTF